MRVDSISKFCLSLN